MLTESEWSEIVGDFKLENIKANLFNHEKRNENWTDEMGFNLAIMAVI